MTTFQNYLTRSLPVY